mgnify:CR=1 FL=1|tara:strand:+ start:53 stop:619 length:567 start_codon:yes stop_codon:yes gene_type:complete
MKILIIFIIILIIIIYINYDFKINKDFQILQLSSNKIVQDILYERNPIIIEDSINNIDDFINVMLSYEKTYKNKFSYHKKNNVNQNLTNYLLLYNSNNKPVDIYISHPRNRYKFNWTSSNSNNYLVSNYIVTNYNNINNTQFVKITLRPKQTIILPKFWLFSINGSLTLISLFGFINYFMSTYISITK